MSPVTHERVIQGNEVFEHLAGTWADIEILDDGDSRTVGDIDLTHRSAPIHEGGENAISTLLLESDGASAFLSPDENRHLDLDSLPDVDLWVKETGYFTETPAGEPIVTEEAERNALAAEMTFEESLAQVREVQPRRTVFTEIEEAYRRSYGDYWALAEKLREEEGLDVAFAHDGMELSV
jgi:hypothetical protein